MIYKTDKKRGEFVDFVFHHNICTTPKQSKEDQLYSIGNNEVFVTIQCTKYGFPVSATVVKHEKMKKSTELRFWKITNQNEAIFISNICKHRIKQLENDNATRKR